MKNKIKLLVSLVAGLGFAAFAGELDLAGKWRLSAADGMVRNVPALVPGGVYLPIIENTNVLWDPFFANKELAGQWVGKSDWTYEREFDCPKELAAKRHVVLRLEDVDTFAEIYLNGTKIGETCDRFKRWEFPLDGVLKSGSNSIRVAFKSTDRKAFEIASASDHFYPGSGHGTCGRINYVRTRQCSGGWDWGISAIDAGMMGTVKILDADPFRVDYVWCEQDFAPDYSRCTVTVHAEVSANDNSRESVSKVVVEHPKLWWPSGMGEQNMTEIAYEIEGVKFTKRIGLRKIETMMEKDADGGMSLGFRVNGVNFFAKGANWIPCDAYEHRQTPERYRDLLESAKAANMNMLRLWGGGQFEKDVFYDLCDELGIMIWHDFMFACQTAPTDAKFFGLVKDEICHQVKRLRDHAAIALWCGDNECTGYSWVKGSPAEVAFYHNEHLKRTELIGSLLKRLDPSRTFVNSSPYGGPTLDRKLANAQNYADTHSWTVWWSGAPIEQFLNERPRFSTEYGFQSFPALEVVETYCPKGEAQPGSCAFEHHQKMPGGNHRIHKSMAHYFGVPKTPAGVLYLSQQQQAMAIKTATEAWRSLSPYCRGTLFWQLNDNWPVSSWSSIDYGGKWKALQYHAKRFFQPQIATVTTNGAVICVNDRPTAVKAKLTLETWTFEGRLDSTRTLDLTLTADSAAEVTRVAPRADAFVVTRLKTADGVHVNDRIFSTYREAPLAAANVTMKVDGFKVTLETDRPAFFVWVNAYKLRGEFDDNSFTLLPGRSKTLVFTPKDPRVTSAAFKSSLSVRHLRSE